LWREGVIRYAKERHRVQQHSRTLIAGQRNPELAKRATFGWERFNLLRLNRGGYRSIAGEFRRRLSRVWLLIFGESICRPILADRGENTQAVAKQPVTRANA
jgi:hypothetical protein